MRKTEARNADGSDNTNEDWLKNFIANKIETALNDEDGDVSEVRQYNFNRYYGKQYGNERDGHSKFTTREVFEAVEWAMPAIIKVFTSNDRAVEFLANSEEDEEQAAQETDVANYYIQVENNGFLMLHNWAKDMLMNPNGYVKAWVEEKDVVKYDTLSGLTLIDLDKLQQDPAIELSDIESYMQAVDDFGMQELYRLKVKYTAKKREIRIESLPPDEVLIDDSWTSVDIGGCPFVCHRVRKSVSDLVQMGYDYEDLTALADTEDNTWNDERVNRLFYEEESPDADNDADEDGASKKLWVHDMSIAVDFDDDGIAERRHIVMIGDEIFDNEEDDYQGVVACASIIMPHKHIAMSYVESVSDLQLYATTITRQMLDNIYAQTDKRHYFNENALLEDNSTLDDYLDARSQAIVVKGNPAEAVMPEITAPITPELLSVIGHIKDQTKLRTGVAPELSLDPATLQQSTMGAFMGALDQASQRLDMLVRVIAEVGYKRLMQNVHTLLRRYINEPEQVKLRGSWVEFDPSSWKERTKMKVNVGLGFNNKQQKMQLLMGVLGLQKEAAGQNLSDHAKIYNTLERLIESTGLGNASSYFTDPSQPVGVDPQTGQPIPWQPPQPAPDANMIMAQAQAQALGQEQQRKMIEAQVKAQSEQQKMQLDQQKMQSEVKKTITELQLQKDQLNQTIKAFEDKYEIESAEALAGIREKNASTLLKNAQAVDTYANADKKETETRIAGINASEEVKEARDILDNGITEATAEDADSSTEEA